MKRMISPVALLTLVLGLVSTNATAIAIHGFGSPSSNPALAGATVIDFEAGGAIPSFTSLTIGDVTFDTNGTGTGYTSTQHTGAYNSTGAYSLQNGTQGFQTLNFTFGSAVDAFGFNFGASNEDWQLSAYGSGGALLDTYLLPQTWYDNNGEYFGLETAGIAWASLEQLTHVNEPGSGSDHILLDNFSYVTSEVPEPSALALLGLGLVVLGFVRRRKS